MSKRHNLRKINLVQFYIQFVVACLFGYDAFMLGNKIKMFIAFLLLTSGNTSISDNTWTKLTYATENLDTDSACSDSRFTVPSGEGGYYQISFSMNMGGTTDGQGNYVQYKLYKNGSEQTGFGVSFNGNPGTVVEEADLCFSGLISLAAGDYLEVYGRMDVASGGVTTNTGHFCGIKVIGA